MSGFPVLVRPVDATEEDLDDPGAVSVEMLPRVHDGTSEDADPRAFGRAKGGAPVEIMLHLVGARLFEAEDLAALRIDPGPDVAGGAVLSCGVPPSEISSNA